MAIELAVHNFSFRYSAAQPKALSALSFEITPGQCCAILGPTGSGKSTLFLALAGVLGIHFPASPAEGEIQIGKDLYSLLPRQMLFPTVGMALQDASTQISGMRETVYDEIQFTLENIGVPQEEYAERISKVLDTLEIASLAQRKPTELSGGEIQKVGIATILVANPSVLLLDEPLTGLDSMAQIKIKSVLRALRGRTTILFSDYAVDLAVTLADIVIVLDRGETVFSGDKKSFILRMHEFQSILPVRDWTEIRNNIQDGKRSGSPIASRLSEKLQLS